MEEDVTEPVTGAATAEGPAPEEVDVPESVDAAAADPVVVDETSAAAGEPKLSMAVYMGLSSVMALGTGVSFVLMLSRLKAGSSGDDH